MAIVKEYELKIKIGFNLIMSEEHFLLLLITQNGFNMKFEKEFNRLIYHLSLIQFTLPYEADRPANTNIDANQTALQVFNYLFQFDHCRKRKSLPFAF